MNKVILVGRFGRDPELRISSSGVSVVSFSVACDRRYVKQGEERKADFINCIAWRQSAEAIFKHFKKGDRIALVGSIQVREWFDSDGNKRYATEVVVDEWEFAQSKSEGASVVSNTEADIDGFVPVSDEDLPF